MKVFGIICSLIFVLNQTPTANARQRESEPAQTRQAAERLWELAVAAKGGRERLHAVRNLLVTVKARNHWSVELYAFPDKFWLLASDPEPLGRYANMYNLERGFAYTADGARQGGMGVRLHESNLGGGRVWLDDGVLLYLLETRTVKPTVVSVSNGEVGWRHADVIRTTLRERIVDFYLDRKTHLPLKVALVSDKDGKPYWYQNFSDYVVINGIQMPRTFTVRSSGKMPIDFQFNVDYDEQLFERAPSALAAPDVWKAKLPR